MRKQILTLSVAVAALFIFLMAGCNSKSKVESREDQPPAMTQTEQKAEEAKPAMEHPDSSKPKDHPAH